MGLVAVAPLSLFFSGAQAAFDKPLRIFRSMLPIRMRAGDKIAINWSVEVNGKTTMRVKGEAMCCHQESELLIAKAELDLSQSVIRVYDEDGVQVGAMPARHMS